jgi:hypothetical protein
MAADVERTFKPGSETALRPTGGIIPPPTPFERQAFKTGVGSPTGATLGAPSTQALGEPAVPFPQGQGMTPIQQRGMRLPRTPEMLQPFVGEGALPVGGRAEALPEKAKVEQYTKTGEKIPTSGPRIPADIPAPVPKFGQPGFLAKQMTEAAKLNAFKKAQKAGAKKPAAEDEDIFGGPGTITVER